MTGAVEPRPRGPGGEPQRKGVKVDRYGIFQVRREFGLKAREAWVLMSLALLADWRTTQFEWAGTITELHEDTGLPRRAVSQALDKLESERCIAIIQPFSGGQDAQGRVCVLVYEALVVLYPGQASSRQSARDLRGIREDIARDSRSSARSCDSEQAKRDPSGKRLKGKEEVPVQPARASAPSTDFGLSDDDFGDARSDIDPELDELLERDDDAPPPTDQDLARYGGDDDEPVPEALAVAWVRSVFGDAVAESTP